MACGWVALALTMMLAARLGAREGRLLDRRDSRDEGHLTGDYVVGYIAAAFV